jgi:predicted RNase H-like HicB family nuclease
MIPGVDAILLFAFGDSSFNPESDTILRNPAVNQPSRISGNAGLDKPALPEITSIEIRWSLVKNFGGAYSLYIATRQGDGMDFVLEFDQEADERWIAEIPELPGVMAYGATRMQAGEKAKALALRVLADRIESENVMPVINHIAFSIHNEPVAVS